MGPWGALAATQASFVVRSKIPVVGPNTNFEPLSETELCRGSEKVNNKG